MTFDPSAVKLPAEITKHNGYYNSEEAAERYRERKAQVQAQYAYEKITGKRRRDGAPNLKKLRPRHLRMISMFVSGVPSTEIALHLNVSHTCVLRVLKDPLAKQYIDDFAEGHKADFNAMFPLVNEAISEGLQNPSVMTKLKAVDRWHKLHRTVNGEDTDASGSAKTKEITAARFRFIDKLKELAAQHEVVEAEFITVSE